MRLLLQQGSVAVGTTDGLFLTANEKRRGLVVSAPAALTNEESNTGTINGAVDTSTTGIKSTYTVPAGQQATLEFAAMFETTGTTVVARLQLVRGATTINLASFTAAGTVVGPIPLQAGDVVQWNVTTAVAASITDFSLFVILDQKSQRVSLSITGAAVLDQGINLQPGTLPLQMVPELWGDALRNEIRCIANVTGITLAFWELMEY